MFKFLKTTEPIYGNGAIYFDYAGVGIVQVDASHVAMVNTFLDRQVFERYEVLSEPFYLDYESLLEALQPFRFDDELEIVFDFSQDSIDVKISVEHGNKKTYFWQSDELLDGEVTSLPELSGLDNSFELENEDIRLLTKYNSECLRFQTLSEHGLKVSTDKDDRQPTDYQVYMEILIESESVKELKQNARSLYASDYLRNISKTFNKTQTFSIVYGDDYPTQVNFERENGAISGFYYIAPRIESR